VRIGKQALDQCARPRRRGDDLARLRAEAQRELQHIERGVGAPPFRQLVRPRGAELRAAQTFRIIRRKRLGDRAIAPFDAPPARYPDRAFAARMRGEHAGHAFDHHLAHIVLGFADQRDAPDRLRREGRQPQR